jgi:hypothetical protein
MNHNAASPEILANDVMVSPADSVTQSTLGKIGLFGDQLLQYAFLRIYANLHGLAVQVPHWDGRRLFGLNDAVSDGKSSAGRGGKIRLGVDAMLPVIADYLGVDWKNAFGLLTRKHAGAVPDIGVEFIKGEDILGPAREPHCTDLFGWFQFHTRYYAPHKAFLRALFRPVKPIENPLEQAWQALAARGKTIIGIHMRRGDRLGLPLNTNEWVAPVRWHLEWLDSHWHSFDKPVLFLASDSIDAVHRHFAAYQPVTANDLVRVGPRASCDALRELPPYYPDFFFLSRCDIVVTSNSMFSFTASMLNDRARLFLRPDLGRRGLMPFDPWNSKPILRRNMYASFYRRYGDYLRISYLAGGMPEVIKSLLRRIPRYWLLRWGVNTLGRFHGRKLRFYFESY